MNAEEARKIATETTPAQQALRKLMHRIEYQARVGERSTCMPLPLHQKIHHEIKRQLIELGYEVEVRALSTVALVTIRW
jgi:hypothetical protein